MTSDETRQESIGARGLRKKAVASDEWLVARRKRGRSAMPTKLRGWWALRRTCQQKKENAVLPRVASNCKEVEMPVGFGHAGGNRPARNLD